MGNVKFKWNPTGYREVKNFATVQAIIDKKAQAVADKANADLSGGGYTSIKDFEVHPVTINKDGSKAKIVVTHSAHAMYSQNKHKTLTNALGAARE